MQYRPFGRTGLNLSVLGFGCGAVGGLMVRGTAADQEHAVGRARDVGINYFDTAVQYGDGESERALGRALAALEMTDVIVGTKVRLVPADAKHIGPAIIASVEGSLRRLGRDHVDILHLHNRIGAASSGDLLTPAQVLDEVLPAFERLRTQGKIRFRGITATGETVPLHQVLGAGGIDSAQIVFNLLNPSAAGPLPQGFPAQDYAGLLDIAAAHGTGAIGIRVLAGGALSGSAERHPNASPPPVPIGSAASYLGDQTRARRFAPLLREGFAADLAEAATRFALSHPAMGTVLVGMATIGEFEKALAAVERGPLPPEALARLAQLQHGFTGEAR